VWGSLSRTAFDCHLQGNAACALLAYAEAAELGYTVASGNAAYVLDKHSAALAPLWGPGQEVYTMCFRIVVRASRHCEVQ
jgi:hypothetical protein